MKIFKKRNRSRKKSKSGNLLRIGTISVVIIAALGIIGAVYASWDQLFGIFGSISTGHLNVIVRDVVLESSDSYETCSVTPVKENNEVKEVDMNVVTEEGSFNATLAFTVENNGTVPVKCTGVDKDVNEGLQFETVGDLPQIEPGHTGTVRVKITKSYCEVFEFSSFLHFVQAT